MVKALYICYFGLRQPLVQTQVLPYLRELLKDGHEMTLLTFEPDFKTHWTVEQIAKEQKKLSDQGIQWQCLAYHKRPSALATAYDIFRGAARIRRVIGEKKIDLLHGRVHVPTLMGALARKVSRRKPKLLFDIRGFFPEEYTDAGIWPADGMLFRLVKRVEAWLMREADGFVVLTEKARVLLFPESGESGADKNGRPVEVIPCCVDLSKRFSGDTKSLRASKRSKLSIEDRLVYVHAGALGGLYLTEQIADLLHTARDLDRKTFAMFLTQSDANQIITLLRERGFDENDYFVGRIPPHEIPAYLASADAGLSFVKAGYATQSRSPTKIPEYLASGLPIIANRGVGDVDALIDENGVGVLADDFTGESYLKALSEIEALGDVRETCRETAVRNFDLQNVGGHRYRRLYTRLTTRKDER
jgi:glycosyltransferase involved in cell wall biosynthesis